MSVDILEYYSEKEWKLMKAEAKKHDTPSLIVDLDIIRKKYKELDTYFPFAKIYYAVKANPAVEVLSLLNELGANFDIASRYELDRALSVGCHPDMAIDLLMLARDLNLSPAGISFHVGSQQREIGAWDSAIAKVRYIFDYLQEEGIHLNLINMGGGFPANYISKTNSMEVYSNEITRYLKEDFGDDFPEIILEPGRSLVGESGIVATEVVLVSKKSHTGLDRWLYLDAGKFNGLTETWDESIKYPLYCEARGEQSEDFIIAGPTCDSQDIMYEFYRNPLPAYIKPGDRVYWLSCGAYTASYASVEFNGFPPIPVYFVDSGEKN